MRHSRLGGGGVVLRYVTGNFLSRLMENILLVLRGMFVPSRKHLLSTLCAPFVLCSISGSLVHDGRQRPARRRSRGSKLRQLASDFCGPRCSCHLESPVVLCTGSVSCIVRSVLVVLLQRRESLPTRHHLCNLTWGCGVVIWNYMNWNR